MPTPEPWFPSDTSTGYLQDAIAGRGIWCKEKNLLSCSKDQKVILICLIVLFLAKVVIVKFLWLKIHYLDNQVDEFPMFSTTTAHPLHGMYALVSFSIYVQQFHCQLIINHQCVLLFFDFC